MMLESMVLPGAASALIASSADAIIGLTLEGIVTSWNPGAEQIYGYTAGEMIGYRIHRLVPDELHDAESHRIERAASGDGVRNTDAPRLTRSGGKIIVSSSFFAVRDDRYRITSVGVIERDVTKDRALEAQLLQAKRMEAVGRLAGGVAQEFNNIVTAIVGLAGFAAERIDDAEAKRDIDGVIGQATRASRLAGHLLSFSERAPSLPGPVCVNGTLRSMEPLLQRLVGERVWLTLDLDPDDVLVRAATNELELVLFELVMRAADMRGGHGALSIATRRVAVDESSFPTPAGVPSGDYAEIEIRAQQSDTPGDGESSAPWSASANAFDSFGMMLVYSVAKRFDGQVVSMDSLLGTQSGAVSVYIPVMPATSSTEPVPSRSTVASGETILLVEDEEAVRDVVARALRARGYEVLEARHGEDALNIAEAHAAPIDLVVSDVVMPQMDGRALFERLRGWYPGIRFLFVSGYTRGSIDAGHLRGPRTDFLAKPFTMDALCAAVGELLERTTG